MERHDLGEPATSTEPTAGWEVLQSPVLPEPRQGTEYVSQTQVPNQAELRVVDSKAFRVCGHQDQSLQIKEVQLL